MIVLDLSEQQGNVAPAAAPSAPTPAPSSTSTTSMSNNVLSDILQMTGIMTDEEEAVPSSQETISEPQKCTTTLQKGIFFLKKKKKKKKKKHFQSSDMITMFSVTVPGDSSSWILLDSNGSKNEESIKETPKMDIFSQAMASAEIGDFAENNGRI